jgi:hypothetical protein
VSLKIQKRRRALCFVAYIIYSSLFAWVAALFFIGLKKKAHRSFLVSDGIERLRSGDFVAIALAEGNADAIIASNPDLCKSGFYFELTVDLLDNLILLQKGNDELTAAVNDLLAQAEEAGHYEKWYAEALEMAGIGMEIHYDDQGNVATEG